jgi:hypothetical protein
VPSAPDADKIVGEQKAKRQGHRFFGRVGALTGSFRLFRHFRQFARESLHLVYFRLALLVVRRSIPNIVDSEVQRFFQHCDLGLSQFHGSSVSLIIFRHNMGGIRHFGEQEGHAPPLRNIDNDAPAPMRQELLAVIYDLLPQGGAAVHEEEMYYGIEQMLGVQAAGNPIAGWRQRLGRDLANADWVRIYDVMGWVCGQFRRALLHEVFRHNVNRVLAGHGVVWDLGEDGRLHRVIPAAAQAQVNTAFAALSAPQYAPALALFNAARDAYDDRPRRERDVCANIFDALESVAKIKYNRPNDSFGQVKNHIEQNRLLRPEVIAIFTGLNDLRNRNFGHGMAVNFGLTEAEVNFTYLACIAAILLLTQTP